ncbi:MAG: hypothetical protein FWG37_07400 [Clostridia bacterium]|nr:hypothetical protein [Clostridia bacterium]
MNKAYLRGIHDQHTFDDVMLCITYTGDDYEIPFGPRTYVEITEREWLTNPNDLERRNVAQ